ncbi:UPF0182 family protein [Actinomycetes bacterium KLBMP 9759]
MRPPVGAPSLTRRTRILLIAAGVLVLLLLGGSRMIGLYIDWLWFGEVGFRGVFATRLFTQIVQFIVGGLLVGGLVALSLWIAYRSRPVFVPVTGPEDPIARYRTLIIQRLRVFAVGIPVAVGLIAGFAAVGDWQTVQLFLNSTPFGVPDPQFGIDVSFYAFQLPFYRYLLDWLFVAVAVSFAVALVTHYIFGGIRLTGRAGQVSTAARAQLAIIAGIFVLLKAVAYYFDRYELLYNDRSEVFTGATYTDLNAVMPAKLILLIISIICAAAFFVAVFRRNLQLPAIATVLLVLSSVLIGAAWPAVLQQFVVAPNANEREAVSIERNIAATRFAYGIGPDKVKNVNYSGTSEVLPAEIRNDKATVPNIRLLDPAKISDTFTQRQAGLQVFGFAPKLDIDRYQVGDKTEEYVVAARELNSAGLTGNQTDWINRYLVYTHGNGMVVAPANRPDQILNEQTGAGGLPAFTSIDIDASTGDKIPESMRVQEPRIYYGELIDNYSIVGAQQGATPLEYDSDTRRYTYTGKGGVSLGNFVNRLVFSIYYGERNILFNSSINDNSKIMYVRNPRDRVQQVAPWLTPDTDPYPAIVDGRIQWIVDGFTTLKNFPYAERTSLGQATADTLQGPDRLDQQVSYMRNSVKATVDAYDGTVTLYAFDEQDPVLQTWMKAFPGTVKPKADISPSLQSHLRYPEDQFKVQRELLTKYHVDNPIEFYGNVSFWDVPSDPTVQNNTTGAAQPPYYVLAGQPSGPNQSQASFQLTSPLVFRDRQIMSAYMSASSDPDTYGQISLLQLPSNTQTLGPQQVQTTFLGTTEVSSQIGLLTRNGQSSIVYGNLLTLPVAGGLLFVEPVYIERTGSQAATSYPQLARVLVYYNGRVGFSPDISKALDQVFGAGAGAGATQAPGSTGGTPAPGATPTAPGAGGTASPALAQAATEIQTALNNLKAAQRDGNFAAQGEALAALDAAVQKFQAAQAAPPAAAPPAAPPANPTPAPGPGG